MTFQERIQHETALSELLSDEKYFIESYTRAGQFLSTIREEKVWKNSRYTDAIFSYQQAKESFSTLFHPIIDLFEIEVKFLQWILCPMEMFFVEIENCCDFALERLTILRSTVNSSSNQEALTKNICQTMLIEYLLCESEITLLLAVIDLKKGNFTSSAHKFLKSYQKIAEVKKLTEKIYEEEETKFETAYFLQMCEHRPVFCDQKLLQSLDQLIQEKLNEIRSEYTVEGISEDTNNVLIADQTLQATRDLLQLKQLYKELSTEYQQIEQEKTLLQQELAKPTKSSKAKKLNKESSHHNDENYHPNVSRSRAGSIGEPTTTQIGGSKNHKALFDRNSALSNWSFTKVSETCGNLLSTAVDRLGNKYSAITSTTSNTVISTTTIDPSSTSSSTTQKQQQEDLVNSIMSPKKVEMPVVSVLLPRISDVAKMFDFETNLEIKRRKSQQQQHSLKTRGNQRKPLAHLDLARAQRNPSASMSPLSSLLSSSFGQRIRTNEFDFTHVHEIFQNDFFASFFIQSRARIAFIESIFTIGLSLLPRNSQWVLEILQRVSSSLSTIDQALSALYKLHLYDHHRWNKFVTLVLINLPRELYLQVWNHHQEAFPFLPEMTLTSVEQIYAVLEAQTIMKPWTSKNPLWLASLARLSTTLIEHQNPSSNNTITTHIHKRIDYYRRALAFEADALPFANCLGFYEMKNALARDLLSSSNWILALKQSRELLERHYQPYQYHSSLWCLYNYTIIQSASAALILQEFFNCQKLFMSLKFSNHKFIFNPQFTTISQLTYEEMSDIIAAFNFHQYLGEMKRFRQEMTIPFSYQTIYHRISEYEDYYIMLQREVMLKRSQESSDEEKEIVVEVIEEFKPQIETVEGEDRCSEVIKNDNNTVSGKSIDVVVEKNDEELFSNETLLAQRQAESLKVEYFCFWGWLMPLETVYLIQRPFGQVQEAAHSSMLSICDKGALLFADRYLLKTLEREKLATETKESDETVDPTHITSDEGEEKIMNKVYSSTISTEDEPYLQMGFFIKEIVIEEVIAKEPAIIRKAIYPTNKLKLYFEEVLMTGEKQLRIDCDENYSTLFQGVNPSTTPSTTSNTTNTITPPMGNVTTAATSALPVWASSLVSTITAKITAAPDTQNLELKAIKILQKLKERHGFYEKQLQSFYHQSCQLLELSQPSTTATSDSSLSSSHHKKEEVDDYQWIRLEVPKKPEKVFGDQLMTWLLLRGLILIELNRVGEAIMMFKLMECYKETAPRTKFAMFVAYYHLAEIVLQYEVCDYPVLIAAEYLKRASVYLQRAFDSKCYHYIHDYHPKILALTERLLESLTKATGGSSK